MAISLSELQILARNPQSQAEFWATLLGAPAEAQHGVVAVPELTLRFVGTDVPKKTQGRIHFDLTSDAVDAQRSQVETVLRLGGQHVDIGQDRSDPHVVLADPEGNELCVIPAGSRFLANTGRIGAVNCDGTHALGVFWSHVLDWPLVWDEGEESAIQSPAGGSKFTWSGPPLMERESPQRITFKLAAQDAGDLARLVELGATALDEGRFLDPDGNEFVTTLV